MLKKILSKGWQMSETGSTENEESDNISVMRKMSSRRLVGSAKRMNPVLALKAALPKAAELELNMRLTVKEAKEGVLDTQAMMEAIPEDALLTILSARDGAQGLAGFDPQLLAALIEVQTTGIVSKLQATVRPWTITDGQMCEPFIDRVFDMLELLLDADGRGPWFYGYRFLRKVNDRRKLAMTLEETRYLFYACKVELGDEAKTGMLWLALPDSVRHATTEGNIAPGNEDWQGGLRASVLNSNVQLDAVLHRTRVPLSWLMSLKPGDTIPVPGQQLDALSLIDSSDRIVGTARLGQASGLRAIRLMTDDSDGGVRSASVAPASLPAASGMPDLSPPVGGFPDLPGAPDLPPEGGMEGIPDLPGALPDLPANVPDLPSAGDLPGLPDLSTGGGLPDLPAAGGLPSIDDGSDLPGLPDLPDLPPLPV